MPRLVRILALLAAVAAGPAAGRAQPAEPLAGAGGRIALTPEEQAWIAAHPVVLVGHDPTYPPYAFLGPDGQLTGIDLDYLALIARRTGLRFDNRAFADWPKAMEEFKAGRIDVVTSLGRTPEREAYTIYTRPYTYAPNVIVTRTDTPYIIDLRELKGRRVGVARGYGGLINILQQNSPDCIVVEYDNMDKAIEAVARGGVDAVIADVVNASYAIKALHFANLRLGSVVSGGGEIYIGVARGRPLLAQIIDRAVGDITAAERKEIDDRWIGVDISPNRWARAFQVAAVIAAIAVGVFVLVFFHNRRLARELTERRRIQIALEEAHGQLARVSEEKSELLRMVAHDLRSPLTGFQLGTELLETDPAPMSESARETLGQMRIAIRQMMRLVNTLVDVQILEEGRRDYEWAQVDFSALVRESVAALAERAAQKKIQLSLRTEAPALPLLSDATVLRQVTDNLISNALKYSPAGTEVFIDLRRADAGYRLLVCDQGPGVKPDERERIFQKYARGSAEPTGGEKSVGLGLWIVRRFIGGLHGRVWHEPGAGGVGSVFVVEVPLAPPAPAVV